MGLERDFQLCWLEQGKHIVAGGGLPSCQQCAGGLRVLLQQQAAVAAPHPRDRADLLPHAAAQVKHPTHCIHLWHVRSNQVPEPDTALTGTWVATCGSTHICMPPASALGAGCVDCPCMSGIGIPIAAWVTQHCAAPELGLRNIPMAACFAQHCGALGVRV